LSAPPRAMLLSAAAGIAGVPPAPHVGRYALNARPSSQLPSAHSAVWEEVASGKRAIPGKLGSLAEAAIQPRVPPAARRIQTVF